MTNGIAHIGQFVTDADLAFEAQAANLTAGDAVFVTVDDNGCATGGIGFVFDGETIPSVGLVRFLVVA